MCPKQAPLAHRRFIWSLAEIDEHARSACSMNMTSTTQIDAIIRQLDDATDNMRAIVTPLDDSAWSRRPSPQSWSVAECIQHLNLSSRAYIEPMTAALEKVRFAGRPAPSHYRRDLFGWILCRSLEPPARRKFVTAAPFNPAEIRSRDDVVAEWEELQTVLKTMLEGSREYNIARERIRSPFNSKISYHLYSAFCIFPVHQRRHLWQARNVLNGRQDSQ